MRCGSTTLTGTSCSSTSITSLRVSHMIQHTAPVFSHPTFGRYEYLRPQQPGLGCFVWSILLQSRHLFSTLFSLYAMIKLIKLVFDTFSLYTIIKLIKLVFDTFFLDTIIKLIKFVFDFFSSLCYNQVNQACCRQWFPFTL